MSDAHSSHLINRDKLRTDALEWLKTHQPDATIYDAAATSIRNTLDPKRRHLFITPDDMEFALELGDNMLGRYQERDPRSAQSQALDSALRALRQGLKEQGQRKKKPAVPAAAPAEQVTEGSIVGSGLMNIRLGTHTTRSSHNLPIAKPTDIARSVFEKQLSKEQLAVSASFWKQLADLTKSKPGGMDDHEVDGLKVRAGRHRASGGTEALYITQQSAKDLESHLKAKFKEHLARLRTTRLIEETSHGDGIHRRDLLLLYPSISTEIGRLWLQVVRASHARSHGFDKAALDCGLVLDTQRIGGARQGYYIHPASCQDVLFPYLDSVVADPQNSKTLSEQVPVSRAGLGKSNALTRIVTNNNVAEVMAPALQRAVAKAKQAGVEPDDEGYYPVKIDGFELRVNDASVKRTTIFIHPDTHEVLAEWGDKIRSMGSDERKGYAVLLRGMTESGRNGNGHGR